MSKNILFKVMIGLIFIAVAVVWLLSAMGIIEVSLSWIIAAFAGALGIMFILKGLFAKNLGMFKKMNILFGAGLIVAGIFALVGTIIDDNLVMPIIAIVITVAILLTVLATGGKKWDQADNQNVGYKNYYERKKEAEEQAKKDAE